MSAFLQPPCLACVCTDIPVHHKRHDIACSLQCINALHACVLSSLWFISAFVPLTSWYVSIWVRVKNIQIIKPKCSRASYCAWTSHFWPLPIHGCVNIMPFSVYQEIQKKNRFCRLGVPPCVHNNQLVLLVSWITVFWWWLITTSIDDSSHYMHIEWQNNPDFWKTSPIEGW